MRLVISLALLAAVQCAQKKINSLNVLMPVIQEPLEARVVHYQMEAYEGCYSWSSS